MTVQEKWRIGRLLVKRLRAILGDLPKPAPRSVPAKEAQHEQ